MPTQRAIEMEELSQYFKMPEKAVAKHLGICLTSLKKICRQNGIHRWPYRKIKSLDKKLRKLENAMVNAKDDPSMVHAVSGYSVPSECSDFVDALSSGSASPSPSASEASMAPTPRQHAWTPTASPPQQDLEDFPQQLDSCETGGVSEPAPALSSVPVSFNKPLDGQPIKVELSLSADMLKQMADGTKNFTFVVQGVNGETQFSVNGGVAHQHVPVVHHEEPYQPEVKEETDPALEMSDEDIIAMLADCASAPVAAPVKAESFAQVIADSAAPTTEMPPAESRVLEPADAELMAALAGCCGGNPFTQDFGEHDGGQQGHFDAFPTDEEMVNCFSHGQAAGMEDFLGLHA